MAYQNTPFANLSNQVDSLCSSLLAQNLSSIRYNLSVEAASLENAIYQLRTAVDKVKSSYGPDGPNDNTWNARWAWGNRHSPLPGYHTPPHTPVPDQSPQDFAKLRAEVKELKKKAEKRDKELEDAYERLEMSQHELANANKDKLQSREREKELSIALSTANSVIENNHTQLADEYVRRENYENGAEQYDRLIDLKAKESSRKKKQGDRAGAKLAETQQLKWMSKRSVMLMKAEKHDLAEDAARYVLEKRKEILDDGKIERQETRESQLLLCSILRAQKVQNKLIEAEEYYRSFAHVSYLPSNPYEINRTWAIQNAFGLAQVYAEQRRYSDAETQFQSVWAFRNLASASYIQTLETEALQLVMHVDNLGKAECSAKLLEVICQGESRLPPPVCQYLRFQGLLLYSKGHYTRAAGSLARVWKDASTMTSAQCDVVVGWALALSQCCQTTPQFNAARRVLEALASLPNSGKGPSMDEIKTLLAYVQLQLKDLAAAVTNAQEVFTRRGTQSVIKPHNFNQANILIRALYKQESLPKDEHHQKCKDAHKVWKAIYVNNKDTTPNADQRVLLSLHVTVGNELAAEWKRVSRLRRIDNPKNANDVIKEARELQALASS